MIRVAICDDDVALTSAVEKMLDKITSEQDIMIDCAVFFDGSTLVENIQQGTFYDLIYLDIEMKNINGINAAERIRSMDVPALIIYVSSYEKYLKELFNTEPFRFLSKPIDEVAFRSAFMAAYKRISHKAEYFSFTYNKELLKLPLGKICYFESRNRIIYIHAAEKGNVRQNDPEYKFYGKMNDVEKQLAESNARFIRIHQSFLVNFDYIKGLTFTRAVLYDGTVLQISEDKQKKVRRQFCLMVGKEAPDNGCV